MFLNLRCLTKRPKIGFWQFDLSQAVSFHDEITMTYYGWGVTPRWHATGGMKCQVVFVWRMRAISLKC